MIILLILLTLSLLLFNYVLSDKDYMHPAVVFHFIFLLYEIVCLCGTNAYAIELHINSVILFTSGFVAITLANIISHSYTVGKTGYRIELKEIRIPKVYFGVLLVFQMVSIIFFYIYLKRLASAYGASYGTAPSSLSGMIKLYDTMTKFWSSIYNELAVPIPMLYRISNPICAGAEYIVLYGMVNNFLIKKSKITICEILVLFLMCVRIVMNGSRSPLLRVFTFIFLLLYVFNYRRGRIRKGNMKFLRRLIIATAGFGVAMFLVLIIMGRTTNFTGISDQLFVYLGAPIVNLDTFLENNAIKIWGPMNRETLFGEQTFKGLYAYIGKLLKSSELRSISSISSFAFSNNGREIGNVYTMFYKLAYDFGYLGIFPITFVMGLYYCGTYRKIMKQWPRRKRIIDFRLLIYAYLFNDVIMSAFSNRFYETVFDAPFIKFVIMAWLIDYFLIENRKSFSVNPIVSQKYAPVAGEKP